jgi:hypothetical protein
MIKALLLWITGRTASANDVERRRRDELADAKKVKPPPEPRQPKPLATRERLFELEPDDFEFKDTRAMVEILRKRRREAKPAWRDDDGLAKSKRGKAWREDTNRGVSRRSSYPADNYGPGRHR